MTKTSHQLIVPHGTKREGGSPSKTLKAI